MPVSTALIRKITKVEPPLREILLLILEEMEKQRSQWEESVTKTEFNELKEIVRDLGKSVAELAETQKRPEKEIAKLARGLSRTRWELGGLFRSIAYALGNEVCCYLLPFSRNALALNSFGGEAIPILVTHSARPEVLEKAQKAGIIVVQSFEWI